MHRTLRVVYLLPAEGFGGAERQGAYHLAELPRHGVEITALAGPGQSLARELRELGVVYEPFVHFPDGGPATFWSLENVRYTAQWLASLKHASSEVERRMRGLRTDLIFANRTFGWLVAALVSRKLGVPYVIRAGSRLAHPALGPALRVLDRAAPPAAVFYNCKAVARAVASRFRCPAYYLPNAVDLRRFERGTREAARDALHLPRNVPLIGLAARPAPEKGLDVLERVVFDVRARNPRTRFIVAGEFAQRAHIEARFRGHGLGESAVRFLGHVDKMPEFFRAMDVVVLTSHARSIEASPNALLEAMASERPVVATAVGGVPELVTDGREGFLVEAGDTGRLSARVLELLDDAELRATMGRAGHARAAAFHRVSAVVPELARNLHTIARTITWSVPPRVLAAPPQANGAS